MISLCTSCRTLPRVRELKPVGEIATMYLLRRTLPRVRELNRLTLTQGVEDGSRTLPRVRELKLSGGRKIDKSSDVAPFPGCVN